MKRKFTVYSSKDGQDWAKAKDVLVGEGIEYFAYESEEPSVGGCGAKLDIRAFGGKSVAHRIYRIDVDAQSREKAEAVLKDKVRPPLSYGVMI